MTRSARSIVTALALLFVLWLVWSRLHIVLWVPIPWWAALIGVVLLFLVVQHVLASLFSRRP